MAEQEHQLGVSHIPADRRKLMQILWATPFNTRSAIGIYSREVCHELVRRGHGVRIMRLEGGPEAHWPLLPTDIDVLGPDEPVPPDIDLVVVNYGNHAPYHAGALRLASQHAIVAIFHDAEMRHFQWGMMDRYQMSVPLLMGEKEPHHLTETGFDMVDPDGRAVLESLSAMTVGAIVHGPHYEPTVAAACPGPVEVIPLCYPNIDMVKTPQETGLARRVVIFGIISSYKQPDRLLRAIGELSGEFGPIEVHLAGPIEESYQSVLTDIAAEGGVPTPIFHGYLSDQELGDVLGSADAICCLRYPVTEGGSASLITALYQGRPLIVSDIASYSMVPDDLIHKISYGEDVHDLVGALREIFLNPDRAEALARHAQAWAETTYSPSHYVDRFETFVDRVMDVMPVQDACRHLAKQAMLPDGSAMPSAMFAMAKAVKFLFSSK